MKVLASSSTKDTFHTSQKSLARARFAFCLPTVQTNPLWRGRDYVRTTYYRIRVLLRNTVRTHHLPFPNWTGLSTVPPQRKETRLGGTRATNGCSRSGCLFHHKHPASGACARTLWLKMNRPFLTSYSPPTVGNLSSPERGLSYFSVCCLFVAVIGRFLFGLGAPVALSRQEQDSSSSSSCHYL